MKNSEIQLNNEEDKDTVQGQINYYMSIPSHIKGSAQVLNRIEFKPAHVVNDIMTIKSGAMNIPRLIPAAI